MDTLSAASSRHSFDEILTDFDLLGDWEDRYRYVIELGRGLEPLAEAEHSPANKVQGCVSQVWLSTQVDRSGARPRLFFVGDSDAHIVRGLIAILFALYSGKAAEEINRKKVQLIAEAAGKTKTPFVAKQIGFDFSKEEVLLNFLHTKLGQAAINVLGTPGLNDDTTFAFQERLRQTTNATSRA